MAYLLGCRDAGETNCDSVAGGKPRGDLFAQAAKHAKEVHGYNDEQLNDPKIIAQMKAIMKQA